MSIVIRAEPASSVRDHSPRALPLRPQQGLLLAALPIISLALLSYLPRFRQTPGLAWSLLCASSVLLVAAFVVFRQVEQRGQPIAIAVRLLPQHYLQALAQGSIYAYWGWYWPPAYAHVPLLAAQIVFAYGCDLLIAWARRSTWVAGFGPFPIILSMNLFLWFKPEWFAAQFAMIAVGMVAKEFIRWERDGRRTHIFNPSSFPLSVASLILIATHTTGLTLGPQIAETQFRPPFIYLWIFLAGLPGQLLFGVASMTMSAVVTTYVFGVLFHAVTGTYYFFETVPIAVFLGMHLLFTDPSTSPRTDAGRVAYGILYGLAVIALAPLVGFYDKLLPVPILNLSARAIDDWVRRVPSWRLPSVASVSALGPSAKNLAYVSLWAAFFATITLTNGIGHTSRGYWLPSWQQACADGQHRACVKLAELEQIYCRDGGSGWSCNELGLLFTESRAGTVDQAEAVFRRACGAGFTAGCENAQALAAGGTPSARAAPRLVDYPVLLVQGQERLDQPPFELFRRACQQGFMSACDSLGVAYLNGVGVAADAARAANQFDKACAAGIASACANLAYQYANGNGVPRDDARAAAHLEKACSLGMAEACNWARQLGAGKVG